MPLQGFLATWVHVWRTTNVKSKPWSHLLKTKSVKSHGESDQSPAGHMSSYPGSQQCVRTREENLDFPPTLMWLSRNTSQTFASPKTALRNHCLLFQGSLNMSTHQRRDCVTPSAPAKALNPTSPFRVFTGKTEGATQTKQCHSGEKILLIYNQLEHLYQHRGEGQATCAGCAV